jgi:integrase
MVAIIGPEVKDFVFASTSKAGHTMPSGAYQALKRVCGDLGFEGIGTHTMRRTFITQLARLGVPAEIRNRLTNHADSSIDGVYNQHDYYQERLSALRRWDEKIQQLITPASELK